MVGVDKAVIARLKKGGNNFEVLVDCDLALALKEGKAVDMKDVLAAEEVFDDSKKGLQASSTQMKSLFGTDDAVEVAKKIVEDGDIQLTSEHRNKLKEIKTKSVINLIHRNGVDPKTKLPHPVERIKLAMEEAKVSVDAFDSVERQVQEVLKKIKSVLPIKFEVKEINIKIPAQYASKSFPSIKSFGCNMVKNEWQTDGSWEGVVELPAGLQDDFFDLLNKLTHGNAETRILGSK